MFWRFVADTPTGCVDDIARLAMGGVGRWIFDWIVAGRRFWGAGGGLPVQRWRPRAV